MALLLRACRPNRARTKGKDQATESSTAGILIKTSLAMAGRRSRLAISSNCTGSSSGAIYPGGTGSWIAASVRFDSSYHEQRLAYWDGDIEIRENRYSVPANLLKGIVQNLVAFVLVHRNLLWSTGGIFQ